MVDLVIISPILSLLNTFVLPFIASSILRRYLIEPQHRGDDDGGERGTQGFELTTMPALMRAKNKFLGLRGRRGSSQAGDAEAAGGAVVNPMQPDEDGVPEAKGDDDEQGAPEAKGDDDEEGAPELQPKMTARPMTSAPTVRECVVVAALVLGECAFVLAL